jgi:hypothetical protein
MPDYLLLMHDDLTDPSHEDGGSAWDPYLSGLRSRGVFQGGSAIGAGICARQSGATPATISPVTGFIRVRADNLDHARALLAGNPVFEAGGTVEIRELPRTG